MGELLLDFRYTQREGTTKEADSEAGVAQGYSQIAEICSHSSLSFSSSLSQSELYLC